MRVLKDTFFLRVEYRNLVDVCIIAAGVEVLVTRAELDAVYKIVVDLLVESEFAEFQVIGWGPVFVGGLRLGPLQFPFDQWEIIVYWEQKFVVFGNNH